MHTLGLQQRLQGLKDNITNSQALLNDFELALLYETNPRIIARYRRDIEQLRESVAIYQQEYNELQKKALLSRYDETEQATIEMIVQEAQWTQLVLTQNLLDALETNQVSELQMQQMLAELKAVSEAVQEKLVPALPPSQATAIEVIKDPELDARHKLKVTLPVVPFLVDYEGELELGSEFNLKAIWETLRSKLQSKFRRNEE